LSQRFLLKDSTDSISKQWPSSELLRDIERQFVMKGRHHCRFCNSGDNAQFSSAVVVATRIE
jgi:hypothetical protein